MLHRNPAIRILLACLALSACASLPDIRYLESSLHPNATPTISTPRGTIPEKKAESLLAKRLRNSKTDIKKIAALEEAATGSPLIAGNKVTLLFDGPQTMSAMMAAISVAKDNINLETYIFDQDELGLRFADLLMAKQRAGVQVNIIYDSVGTLGTPSEFFEKMRAAGIALTEFNPVNPLKATGQWRVNNRDHRKILVVDGRIGFAGGVNIAKDYARSSLFRSQSRNNAELGWRDTHIRIEGPAVASLQLLFLNTWASQRMDDLPDRNYFPPLSPAGDKLLRVIASNPGGDYQIYKAYALAMQEAKTSIHITNAYFAPDVQILEALTQAARRGVDVKVIFPSVSDTGLVFYCGRSFYSELLDAGVKIYELQASVLHAKTAVIDHALSTVGSANIDIRSFLHNSEVNIVVIGDEFGETMESAFREDLKNSDEVTKQAWDRRPLLERIKEAAARSLEYWL
ncbi:MAG: phospholipase family protein [Herminiimonas sp.]|nr:phospholipase family protein [Herminiimonas sp.]